VLLSRSDMYLRRDIAQVDQSVERDILARCGFPRGQVLQCAGVLFKH
jgi:hypothetical protein